MQPVTGTIQHYAWGDTEFIPRLLGVEPDGRPCAELWLGTHPNGPTILADSTPLEAETGALPYLLKVLSAAQPLSLQTHPNTDQARDGFDRGVYPDDRAKPELLYALTPFVALCGMRPTDQTVRLLADLELSAFADHVDRHGSAQTLSDLYLGRFEMVIDPDRISTAAGASDKAEATWIAHLAGLYPGEPSVAAALLLNLVELRPGQVVRLDAGNLHAYLNGSGIELMGASDNVVRGGLTTKPVDVDELLRVVDPTPLPQPVVDDADTYKLPTAGVELTVVPPGSHHLATGDELAIDLDGGTWWYQAGDEVHVDSTTFVARSSQPTITSP